MNILVTGANGQLGTCIKNIVERYGNGEPHGVVGDKDYWIFTDKDELDIQNAEAVNEFVRKNYINVVVNCAAYTNVKKAETDKELAYAINATAAENLANACSRMGAVLIHISTDYVYDGEKNTPYVPECECKPLNVYGTSKLAGEKAIERADCKYLIFRTSWLYSEHGNNFVKTILKRSLANEESQVCFDQVGCPTYAGDLAKFIYHIITDNNAENRYLSQAGTYHYCNRGVASWYDLAHLVYQLTGDIDKISCSRTLENEEVQRPSYSVMDTSLTESVFETRIPHWEDSLAGAIKEIIENVKNGN